MRTIEAKHKRSILPAGIHLVSIVDMYYLRNAAKELILVDGFPTIIIKFHNKAKETHEQTYVLDKSWRQNYFKSVLIDAGIEPTPGVSPKKEEIIGRKLYVAIQEVHYVDDDKIVIEDGDPRIDHHIFKTFKAIEGGIPPRIKGDPAVTGIPQGEFITYKNISDPHVEEKKSESDQEEPQF